MVEKKVQIVIETIVKKLEQLDRYKKKLTELQRAQREVTNSTRKLAERGKENTNVMRETLVNGKKQARLINRYGSEIVEAGSKQEMFTGLQHEFNEKSFQVENRLKKSGMLINENGKFIDKYTGKNVTLERGMAKVGRAHERFQMHLLSVMFFGMAVSKTFRGFTDTLLELGGTTDVFNALKMVFASTTLDITNGINDVLFRMMEWDEEIQRNAQLTAMGIDVGGRAIMTYGQMALGMQGMKQLMGGVIKAGKGLAYTIAERVGEALFGVDNVVAKLGGSLKKLDSEFLSTVAVLGITGASSEKAKEAIEMLGEGLDITDILAGFAADVIKTMDTFLPPDLFGGTGRGMAENMLMMFAGAIPGGAAMMGDVLSRELFKEKTGKVLGEEIMDNMIDAIARAGEEVADFVFGEAAEPLIKHPLRVNIKMGEMIWDSVTGFVSYLGDELSRELGLLDFSTPINLVLSFGRLVYDGVSSFVSDVSDDLNVTGGGIIDTVIGMGTDVWDSVSGFVGGIGSWLSEQWSAMDVSAATMPVMPVITSPDGVEYANFDEYLFATVSGYGREPYIWEVVAETESVEQAITDMGYNWGVFAYKATTDIEEVISKFGISTVDYATMLAEYNTSLGEASDSTREIADADGAVARWMRQINDLTEDNRIASGDILYNSEEYEKYLHDTWRSYKHLRGLIWDSVKNNSKFTPQQKEQAKLLRGRITDTMDLVSTEEERWRQSQANLNKEIGDLRRILRKELDRTKDSENRLSIRMRLTTQYQKDVAALKEQASGHKVNVTWLDKVNELWQEGKQYIDLVHFEIGQCGERIKKDLNWQLGYFLRDLGNVKDALVDINREIGSIVFPEVTAPVRELPVWLRGGTFPFMQHGGIVPRTGPIYAHAGETVLPSGVAPVTFSPTVNISVGSMSSEMDVRAIGDTLNEMWSSDLRRLLIR